MWNVMQFKGSTNLQYYCWHKLLQNKMLAQCKKKKSQSEEYIDVDMWSNFTARILACTFCMSYVAEAGESATDSLRSVQPLPEVNAHRSLHSPPYASQSILKWRANVNLSPGWKWCVIINSTLTFNLLCTFSPGAVRRASSSAQALRLSGRFHSSASCGLAAIKTMTKQSLDILRYLNMTKIC